MIFDQLNTGFRWYDTLEKQNRFKEQCTAVCEFALMAPCNDLLPFQIKTNGFDQPTEWLIKYLDGTMLVPVLTPAVDPSLSWNIAYGSGSPRFGISYGGVKWLGTADYSSDIDSSMAQLVISVNTNTPLGTIPLLGDPFDNSLGFTAAWDLATQTFTLTAPVGSATTYNGVSIQWATFAGSMGGEAGVTKIFAGGANSFTTITDTDTIDISPCIPFISQYTKEGFDYLQYNGSDLPGCLQVQMDCGRWYSTITDGINIAYSEVFNVLPISDIAFVQSRFPLFTAWRWYDQKSKQTRYKEYCENVCDFYLLSGNDRLLPFQIRVPTPGTGYIWKLVGINEDCEYYLDASLLQTVSTGDEDRIFHNGELQDLPCGKFYSVLFDGINTWYSEPLLLQADVRAIPDTYYILQENGFKILQENSSGLLQEH